MVLVAAQGTSAQQLHGRLLDLISQQPLASGQILLLGSDGTAVGATVTDKKGGWSFDLPRPGMYYLEARRMGYETWLAGPVVVHDKQHLDATFHLQPEPIVLDPIEVSVEATRRHLELAGFYERQRSDFGTFLGPEDLQSTTASRITEMLLGFPGARLVSTNAGSTGGRFIQLRGGNSSDNGLCRPRVYVDGLLYARGDSGRKVAADPLPLEHEGYVTENLDQSLGLDDIGPPGDLAGVEIYRSASQVPVQFGGTSVETLCGVIVVWTKRGVTRGTG